MRLDDRNLPDYLARAGVLARAQGASVERVGEGNINFVRRVRPAQGASVIVKQARPGIEGFPDLPLSSRRILFERRYAEVVETLLPGGSSLLPRVRYFDEEARVLVTEDLGPGPSLADALRSGQLPLASIERVGRFLAAVHAASTPQAASLAPRFENREMCRLHGEQLFSVEPAAGALPIPEAVRARVAALRARPEVRERIASLRTRYYESREALVHGDVKAANVLLRGERPWLIDAEFAHLGDPAFDLGSAIAHLELCLPEGAGPRAPRAAEGALVDAYCETAGPGPELLRRARGYAGVDVLYHLLGPLSASFWPPGADRSAALERGIELLLS